RAAASNDGIALARQALAELTGELTIGIGGGQTRRTEKGDTTLDPGQECEAVHELTHNTEDALGGVVLVVKEIVGLRFGWNVCHQITSSPRIVFCGLEHRQDGDGAPAGHVCLEHDLAMEQHPAFRGLCHPQCLGEVESPPCLLPLRFSVSSPEAQE